MNMLRCVLKAAKYEKQKPVSLIMKPSMLRPSSETQGLLVETMRYFWAKVYFKGRSKKTLKYTFAQKYRIVPTNSPWVSEDVLRRIRIETEQQELPLATV